MSSFTDVLRTRYVKLPNPVKLALAPALCVVPFSLRFGTNYWKARSSIQRSEKDAGFVRDFQTAGLREILRKSAARSSHFADIIRDKFGSGADLDRAEVSQIARLPVLTRAEIVDNPDAFLIAEAGRYDIRTTSGSSGRTPLKVYLDSDRSVREMAFLHHTWSRIGYRLGDGRAVLREYANNIATTSRAWRYDAPLRELWLSPFHMSEANMDVYLHLLEDYKVRFLYGIPSAITMLARRGLVMGWKPPRSLKGILSASETLFPHQRTVMQECFNVPITAHYGLSERVAFAGELPDMPEVYEFEPTYGITELVDQDGTPITQPGMRGRIVSTGLFSRSMALIRYETGDHATLVRAPSEENCFRLRVNGLRSRWNQEFVIGYHGERVPIIALDRENYYGIFKEYQYVQTEPGRAVLKIVPWQNASREKIDEAVASMQEQVRQVIDLTPEIVEGISFGSSGKRKFVDQRLPVADL